MPKHVQRHDVTTSGHVNKRNAVCTRRQRRTITPACMPCLSTLLLSYDAWWTYLFNSLACETTISLLFVTYTPLGIIFQSRSLTCAILVLLCTNTDWFPRVKSARTSTWIFCRYPYGGAAVAVRLRQTAGACNNLQIMGMSAWYLLRVGLCENSSMFVGWMSITL